MEDKDNTVPGPSELDYTGSRRRSTLKKNQRTKRLDIKSDMSYIVVYNKGIKDMFVKIDWDSDDIGDVDELLVVESELEKNNEDKEEDAEEEYHSDTVSDYMNHGV